MSLVDCISGNDWVRCIRAGCIKLEQNRDQVDLLNVFPVPDGDTGTNMYLTLYSAVKEGEKVADASLGKVAKAISMGSLMGARGNSGVILSQVFRGMARVFEGKEKADARDLAQALKKGSQTAYEAVMKPVEGTILTVIREIAKSCEIEAKKNNDIVATLLVGVETGYKVLQKTPNLLPILKEAGVVDAGGQGLLFFLEGVIEGLAGDNRLEIDTYREIMLPRKEETGHQGEVDLEFEYCTEVLIKGTSININSLQKQLTPLGDSLLVVGDSELVKVHLHSNSPGRVLETCLKWGRLSDIKINNMVEEAHEHLNNWQETNQPSDKKKIGLVAVGAGEGIVSILKSLGVDMVVEGGQTMNPSTEELVNACNQVNAESIIILPNNSNIIMAAQQVDHLTEKKVEVVPTRSVMQAVTALIAYDPDGELAEVSQAMHNEMKHVQYGEITYAVRDSAINGLGIKEGSIIGILKDEIVVTSETVEDALEKLLGVMANEESELITLFYGKDIEQEKADIIKDRIKSIFPDFEVEIHYGGQPHYSFFVSVE